MFRKFLSVLVVGLWAISGNADETVSVDSPVVADCQKPCPAKPDCPKPCPKPCPPKPCVKPCEKPVCPPPCPKPCPPKPCCNPPPPCCWNFNPCNPKGCTDMNCNSFFLAFDFLYWRAENHGFSYAFEFDNGGLDPVSAGKIVRIDPEWDPAFRIGMGWNTTYDFWDIFLNYTWYRNRAHESRTSQNRFLSLWPVDTSLDGEFANVTAKSRFMLNMGDLELGRMLYLTRTVAIRPHWGLRGGNINQKFSSSFTNGLFNTPQSFSGKNNYWGIGPRTGVNGEMHLSRGFSILGKLAGALLYGNTNVKAFATHLVSNVNTTIRNHRDSFAQLAPNLQMALGFQWQTCFWCEKMFFKMSASWETNYWWNQFNLPFGYESVKAPLPTVGNQPLTMEGLTLNFEWDF